MALPQTVVAKYPAAVPHDYSTVRGAHDLDSSIVQPKCYAKALVSRCECADPLVPSRGGFAPWDSAFEYNVGAASDAGAASAADVVFFGDSITEGWRGTAFNRASPRAEGAEAVFDGLFGSGAAGMRGLALGIAGDETRNLLWRIRNGELPETLSPSVFWVLIGTNDMDTSGCSAEMVVVGILGVVEELLARRPDSTVVLNGILPRTYNRDGYVARGSKFKASLWEEIQAINGELKMYASYRGDRVAYFEARSLFENPDASDSELRIDRDLFADDYLHPTAKGYEAWGGEIKEFIEVLLR